MKATRALLMVGLGLLLTTAAWAYDGVYTPGAGINETPHDLPRGDNGMAYVPNPADSLQRICVYCHAPHNTYKLSVANGGPGPGAGAGPAAADAFDYLPLWNHTLQDNYVYTMYQNGPGAPQTGPKASQAIANGMVPGSSSLLCLSCHDGSVAVNAYGNAYQLDRSRSGGGATIDARYVIGLDQYLGNHHPIGFDYSDVVAVDNGSPAGFTGAGRLGGVRAATNPFGTVTIADHLYASVTTGSTDTMECGSCHSVHNTGNTGETLLWISDQGSNLCLTCHDKGEDPTVP